MVFDMFKLKNLLPAVLLLPLSFSCDFGNYSDRTTLDIKNTAKELEAGNKPGVEFINIASWTTQFQKPVDVHYGFDQLIYVADEERNMVFQFDENGTLLGSYPVTRPTKIGMDRRLNLFIACRYDTIYAAKQDTFPAVIILNMAAVNSKLSASTPILKRQIYPLFIGGFQGNATEAAQVQFTGIATFADNSYVFARTGPSNDNATRPGGYNNSVVLFSSGHQYQGDLSNSLNPQGTGLGSASTPVSITSFAVPPQNQSVPIAKDFLIGMSGRNFYRVQGVRYEVTPDGISYENETKYLAQDTSKSNKFLFSLTTRNGDLESRFAVPSDLEIARDKHQFIFVIDSQLDSLYQFTYGGEEGVPVFGSKNSITSFGGLGTGTKQFNNPRGVAYGKLKLFVADTGNRRIMVYKLSTDITQN